MIRRQLIRPNACCGPCIVPRFAFGVWGLADGDPSAVAGPMADRGRNGRLPDRGEGPSVAVGLARALALEHGEPWPRGIAKGCREQRNADPSALKGPGCRRLNRSTTLGWVLEQCAVPNGGG